MNSGCSKSVSCIKIRSNSFHTNQGWISTIDTVPKIENNEKDSNEISSHGTTTPGNEKPQSFQPQKHKSDVKG